LKILGFTACSESGKSMPEHLELAARIPPLATGRDPTAA